MSRSNRNQTQSCGRQGLNKRTGVLPSAHFHHTLPLLPLPSLKLLLSVPSTKPDFFLKKKNSKSLLRSLADSLFILPQYRAHSTYYCVLVLPISIIWLYLVALLSIATEKFLILFQIFRNSSSSFLSDFSSSFWVSHATSFLNHSPMSLTRPR